MRLLLDTHALLWSITSRRMSDAADAAFVEAENTLYLSIASYWEMCIKLSINKLTLPENWVEIIELVMAVNDIAWLPIEPAHCRELLTLPHHHRDPFDRLLIAQARSEGLTVLTADPNFRRYDVDVIW